MNILKCVGNVENWREHYASAFKAYNRYHCEAISSTKAKFSPIEIWRPGYTVTPYKIQVLRESNPKYFEHFDTQTQLSERINETMKVSNEAYLKRMDERPSNQRRLKSLRQLNLQNLGDRVTRIMPSGNKTIDKLSDLQTGPYGVIEVEESGVDYLIKKIGSSAAPIRCHVDFLNLFKTFDLPADSEPRAPVAAKSTEYSAERIMGEKTHSARFLGGSHSWLSGQTAKLVRSTSAWEPEEN